MQLHTIRADSRRGSRRHVDASGGGCPIRRASSPSARRARASRARERASRRSRASQGAAHVRIGMDSLLSELGTRTCSGVMRGGVRVRNQKQRLEI